MAKAYLVTTYRSVSDPDALVAYAKLSGAAMSQYAQGRVPIHVAAGLARALVEDPNGDDDGDWASVSVSDLPETDADDLAPSSSGPVFRAAPAAVNRTCAQDPVGVAAKSPAVANSSGAPLPSPAAPAAAANAPAPSASTVPPSNAEPDLATQIVRKLATGPAEARVEAAGVVVRFPYLAPDFDAEAALLSGDKQGIETAPLYLGELYLRGTRAARNPKAALSDLQRAETGSTEVESRYFLGRLYQYGYLDEADPLRAEHYLLQAARGGYEAADGALARLYASGKGTCPNHVVAYLFAQLGANAGNAAIRTLRDQLQGTLNPTQEQDAQRLLRQELGLRGLAAPQPPDNNKNAEAHL